jgi:hypothetical protein
MWNPEVDCYLNVASIEKETIILLKRIGCYLALVSFERP